MRRAFRVHRCYNGKRMNAYTYTYICRYAMQILASARDRGENTQPFILCATRGTARVCVRARVCTRRVHAPLRVLFTWEHICAYIRVPTYTYVRRIHIGVYMCVDLTYLYTHICAHMFTYDLPHVTAVHLGQCLPREWQFRPAISRVGVISSVLHASHSR